MKRSVVLAVAAILLIFLSCSKREAVTEESSEAPAVAPARDAAAAASPGAGAPASGQPQAAPASIPADNRAPAVARKLIRTVDLRIQVKSTEQAAAKVQALVTSLGGFVSSANGQRTGDLMQYSITLRVPRERFDEALAAVKALAVRVDREHQQVEDVTDQYIDLDARMRTLEATEAELRALLAESRQRGRKVTEIMEIYRQLVDIRSQIEQIRTQLSSFDKLAALSTLNLELVATEAARPVAGDEWHPSDTLRSSIRSLVSFLKGFIDLLIWVVIVLVPFVLIVGGLIWGLVLIWRRLKRRQESP
jgi:chromosome segregation ATPase